jgi:hypothetical protein
MLVLDIIPPKAFILNNLKAAESPQKAEAGILVRVSRVPYISSFMNRYARQRPKVAAVLVFWMMTRSSLFYDPSQIL